MNAATRKIQKSLAPPSLCQVAQPQVHGKLNSQKSKVESANLLFNRELLIGLINSIPSSICVTDPQHRYILVNEAFARLIGRPPEQILGHGHHDFFPQKAADVMAKVNARVMESGKPLQSEEAIFGAAVTSHKFCLRDASGSIIGICNVATDNTEGKRAQEILRMNRALFSALIDQSPAGVFVLDSELRLQQVNPKGRALFAKLRPLIGRRIFDVLQIIWPKKTADEILQRFQRTLTTGRPFQSPPFSEMRRNLKKSEVYEWQLQRITQPDGSHGVACFFDNVTERNRMESAQERSELLAGSNQRLQREVARRKAGELSLRKSERHTRKLLEVSRVMQEQLRLLSRQVLLAQENERKKISRELHDVVAQTLTGINIRLAALKKEAESNTKGLTQNIANTQRLVEHSVNLVHRFARDLRPAVLDDLGLIPALHSFLKDFAKRTGIRVSLTAFAAVEEIKAAQRTVLFRVAQEALTNVARHASASRVDVSIENHGNSISMIIKNDGNSFNVERTLQANRGRRLGLLGMKERLEMVGGSFAVESSEGNGTSIVARIPGKTRTQIVPKSVANTLKKKRRTLAR